MTDNQSDFEAKMWAKDHSQYQTQALNSCLCVGAILGLPLVLWAAIYGGTMFALWALS